MAQFFCPSGKVIAMIETKYTKEAERTARKQQKLQEEVEETDKKRPQEEPEKAMQAGARKYPEPPMDGQHLEKPGLEAELDQQPMCDAPYYKGSGKLQDKKTIITGGDSGIGRAVAILFA